AEDGIRDRTVTGVQTCALPICSTVPSVHPPRQVLVQAVTQLVGQGHHVTQLVGVVHQDVGVDRGDGAAAEGPAALARPQLGVDRSEERRVGKECNARAARYYYE